MILNVKVHPGAKDEKIVKLNDKEYEVYLRERAEKGKANNELIRLLSREFKVNYKNIKIKGLTSRKKVIEIIMNELN